MLFELADILTTFAGTCLRSAFGKNANGHPDPDNPANHWEIFTASVVAGAVVAAAGSLVAWSLSASLAVVCGTAAIVFGLGLVAACLAAFR